MDVRAPAMASRPAARLINTVVRAAERGGAAGERKRREAGAGSARRGGPATGAPDRGGWCSRSAARVRWGPGRARRGRAARSRHRLPGGRALVGGSLCGHGARPPRQMSRPERMRIHRRRCRRLRRPRCRPRREAARSAPRDCTMANGKRHAPASTPDHALPIVKLGGRATGPGRFHLMHGGFGRSGAARAARARGLAAVG